MYKVTFDKLAPAPPKGELKITKGFQNAETLEEARRVCEQWNKQEGVGNVRVEKA